MNLKKVKRTMVLVMACLCVVGTIVIPGKAVNAKAVLPSEDTGISKSTLTMYPNMAEQLKVVNAGGEVKWSTTNSKVVSILGSRGKNGQIVTIRTENKTGSCKIRAKVKGKTYSCKVTVKKDSNISRVKLVKVRKASKKVQVDVKIINRSGKENWYGHPYVVEKFVDGSWKKMGPSDDIMFTAEAISIPAHTTMRKSYVVCSGDEVKRFTKGVYRLKVGVTGMKYRYVLFSL